MFKLFTVTEATRLLPVIERHVGLMQRARREAAELKQRIADLAERPQTPRTSAKVEAFNLMRELEFVVHEAQEAKAELDRLGVELTDLEHGAVAFPASVGGEVVALTWSQGQASITHYRRLAGDAAPQLLPARAREA